MRQDAYLYGILVVARSCSITHTSVELFPCLAHIPRSVIIDRILVSLGRRTLSGGQAFIQFFPPRNLVNF
jgi:hypothetical protein